uniref:Putative secreted peptide n=1 Tax=Anopheles braziliensis TaxID=58242 RepID=A0A2M3ZRF4_9DIPT
MRAGCALVGSLLALLLLCRGQHNSARTSHRISVAVWTFFLGSCSRSGVSRSKIMREIQPRADVVAVLRVPQLTLPPG